MGWVEINFELVMEIWPIGKMSILKVNKRFDQKAFSFEILKISNNFNK